MFGEIDGDTGVYYYCPLQDTPYTNSSVEYSCYFDCACCEHKRRKYPTPAQFKEEYGFEWEGAMYTKCLSSLCRLDHCPFSNKWTDIPKGNRSPVCLNEKIIEICACTPFGKPADDWRLE